MPAVDNLAQDLSSAIRNRELTIAYQPQISLRDGTTVAVEALCRWNHPEHGPIPPDSFIAVAEASGSIHDLGSLILSLALDAAEDWAAQGRMLETSVNVSALQIAEESFVDRLVDEVARRQLPPSSVVIEITESQPLAVSHDVVQSLHQTRSSGIGVALDDFGAGYATLEQLEGLPLTEVKLDGALIREDTRHSDGALREVIAITKERSMRVVAEGIEDQAQLERAAALNCDRGQGYYICRPRTKTDIDLLLAR